MATELKSEIDTSPDAADHRPHWLDASIEPLARGEELLSILERAARAARLEAQVLQLRSAIQAARAGHPQNLMLWLDRFSLPPILEQEPAVSSALAPIETRMAEKAIAATSQTVDACSEPVVSGWDHYLSQARLRARSRRHEQSDASSSHQVQLPMVEPIDDVLPDDLQDDLPVPGPSAAALWSDPDPVDEAGLEIDGRVADEAQLEPDAIEALGVQPRASCQAIADQSTAVKRRHWSSMGLSLIGHAALLIMLGMITYSAPRDSAALGSQVLSAQSAADDIEVGQSIELPEPVIMDLPEPKVNSESATAEIAAMNQSITAPTLDVTAPSSSSGLSSASALAAAAGGADGGSSSGSGATGTGRGGGPPKVGGQFFGVATGGNFFCYVVDSSGSMRGGAWESAKAELLRSLSSLSASQRFYIVFFSQEFVAIPDPGSREPALYGLNATSENIDHARRWIDTVKIDRGGPPTEALQWAIEREPDAIYLLTDGVTSVDVCAFLRKRNRTEDLIGGTQIRVPIHAIAYHSLDGQQLLRQIAQENSGQFHYVPKPKAKR